MIHAMGGASNDHHQWGEPAAKGARFLTDVTGWIASAEWCG